MDFSKSIKTTRTNESSWEVAAVLNKSDADDLSLISLLHTAKKQISAQYDLKLSSLKYLNLNKRQTESGDIDLSFSIMYQASTTGSSKVRTMSLNSSDGTEYKDMVAYLDLYPETPSGLKTSREDIYQLLSASQIPGNQVNEKVLAENIAELHQTGRPVKDICLIQGKYPSESRDAELKYYCNVKKTSPQKFISADKIESGQLICRKTPPLRGASEGVNVKGIKIPPREPSDIELVAGKNVQSTEDDNEIVASTKGLLHIEQIISSEANVQYKLIFNIETIEEYDGSKRLNITVDKPIEIKGGLKKGSKIVSQREVIISGDIEEEVSIQTMGSIFIEGSIIGADISSQKDIDGLQNVKSSKLTAEGKIVINGLAKNSILSGHEVIVNEACGCDITAGSKIEINDMTTNENGYIGSLRAGLKCHLDEIVEENKKFIEITSGSLYKLKNVFGEEIIDSLKSTNVAQLMIRHSENLKRMGFQITRDEQKETLRKLLGTVNPLREMIRDREESIRQIERKKTKSEFLNPVISVNTSVSKIVKIDIDGVMSEILPEDTPVICELRENQVRKRTI